MRETITWIIESDAFRDGDAPLADAVRGAGGRVLARDDEWLGARTPPPLTGPVVFHGSLGNADHVARSAKWRPGAFCSTSDFRCSAWWPRLAELLLTPRFDFTSVRDLVRNGAPAGFGPRVFVRPDSPLKPFSGRVLASNDLSLHSLDHGFYYDDLDLPVVVGPAVDVRAEWRLVAVGDEIVAGSGYAADGRSAGEPLDGDHPAWRFGQSILSNLPRPDIAFVIDIAEGADGLHLLELNPFSGADLYSCSRDRVVRAIHRALRNE